MYSVENLDDKNIDSQLEDVQSQKENIQKKVNVEKLRLLHVNFVYALPINLINTIVVFIALHWVKSTNLLWGWFLISIVLIIIRTIGYYYYKYDPNLRIHLGFALAGILLSAILWGFAASVLIPKDNLLDQMIIIMIAVGMVSGGIQTIQTHLTAILSWIILILLPLNIWMYAQDELAYFILGILLTNYIVFMIFTGWRSNKILTKALILNYINIELLKTKEQAYSTLEENEERERTIQEDAPIGMAVISLKRQFLRVNNALCEMLGYSKQELLNLSFEDIIYPADRLTDLKFEKEILDTLTKSIQYEVRFIHKNSHILWVLKNKSLIRDKNNQPLYFISQILDITEQKNNEKKMIALNEKTNRMLDTLKQHEYDMVLTTKMNAMLQTCNEDSEAYNIIKFSAQKLFMNLSGGISILKLSAHSMETVEEWGSDQIMQDTFSVSDCWALREGRSYLVEDTKKEVICSHFKVQPAVSLCIPLIVQHGIIGALHFYSTKTTVVSPYEQQLADSFHDVIRLALANLKLRQKLQNQATRDPLTSLYNRRYLHDMLSRELQLSIRNNNPFSMAMIDLDHFKYFNDSYGHAVGDTVLKRLAELLNLFFRGTDIVCRYGGEEFIVVLINNKVEEAFLRLDEFRSKVCSEHIWVDGVSYTFPSISVGLAEAPKDGATEDDIIKAADKALYVAKNHGRNCVEIYEQ